MAPPRSSQQPDEDYQCPRQATKFHPSQALSTTDFNAMWPRYVLSECSQPILKPCREVSFLKRIPASRLCEMCAVVPARVIPLPCGRVGWHGCVFARLVPSPGQWPPPRLPPTLRAAVAGPGLQFFDIVAGWSGSVHDSRIFDNSRLRVLYEENRVPGVLLGDARYACQPYLFAPFSEPGPTDTPKGRYQKAQIKTRNVVERAFGVWKRRFPCLDMGMQHKAKNIVHIITACAALDNLACLLREPEPPAQRVPQPSPISTVATRTVHLPPVDRLTDSHSGNQARDLLIRKSFT
ncbi:hypothetical protein MRX96_045598 [Rhipicephalus microplus]